MRKTMKGSLVGMAYGGLSGVIAALAIALTAGVFVGVADGGAGAGLATFAIYVFFGSIVGGTVGLAIGLVLGALLAATGLEGQARWLTPAALVLSFAFLGFELVGEGTDGGELSILAIAALATTPLGWTAGRWYERAMAQSTPPTPNYGGPSNLPSANQFVG